MIGCCPPLACPTAGRAAAAAVASCLLPACSSLLHTPPCQLDRCKPPLQAALASRRSQKSCRLNSCCSEKKLQPQLPPRPERLPPQLPLQATSPNARFKPPPASGTPATPPQSRRFGATRVPCAGVRGWAGAMVAASWRGNSGPCCRSRGGRHPC